jgi:hypothetical protein
MITYTPSDVVGSVRTMSLISYCLTRMLLLASMYWIVKGNDHSTRHVLKNLCRQSWLVSRQLIQTGDTISHRTPISRLLTKTDSGLVVHYFASISFLRPQALRWMCYHKPSKPPSTSFRIETTPRSLPHTQQTTPHPSETPIQLYPIPQPPTSPRFHILAPIPSQ